EQDVEISLVIRGGPDEYPDPVIKRLLVASLTGSGKISGIRSLSIRRESADIRTGTLVAKGELARDLKIAGKPIRCLASTCNVEIELKEWVLYLQALPNVNQHLSDVRIFPVLRMWTQGVVQFLQMLGVNDVSLPVLFKDGERHPHIKFFAFDEMALRLE